MMPLDEMQLKREQTFCGDQILYWVSLHTWVVLSAWKRVLDIYRCGGRSILDMIDRLSVYIKYLTPDDTEEATSAPVIITYLYISYYLN